MNNKKVLLTGISGYIGNHCAAELLKQGYRVRGSLRNLSKSEQVLQAIRTEVDPADKVEFCQLDLLGNKKGSCAGVPIQKSLENPTDIHSITLYLNPKNQEAYYNFILRCQPQRVIFNPGTENPALYQLLKKELPNCQIEIACTLVMLSLNNFKN